MQSVCPGSVNKMQSPVGFQQGMEVAGLTQPSSQQRQKAEKAQQRPQVKQLKKAERV